MATIKLTVSLDERLAVDLDQLADQYRINRSAMLAILIRDGAERYKVEVAKVDKVINPQRGRPRKPSLWPHFWDREREPHKDGLEADGAGTLFWEIHSEGRHVTSMAQDERGNVGYRIVSPSPWYSEHFDATGEQTSSPSQEVRMARLKQLCDDAGVHFPPWVYPDPETGQYPEDTGEYDMWGTPL